MAKYTFATLDAWAAKVERRAEAVFKQATGDMMASIKIVPGMERGGSPQKGTIPRDLGALANSLQSTLYGSTALSGADSYTMVIGQMELGDTAQFTWGANAPYAKRIHYGWGTYPGTFWRDTAAGKWQGYVTAATARAKAMIP